MLAVCACGRILNPKTARSQVIGAMTMGAGAALMEELAVDKRSGFFVNHDLAGYEVPVHADIPHQEVIFLDETDPDLIAYESERCRGARYLRRGRAPSRMRFTTRPACGCAITRSRSTSCSTGSRTWREERRRGHQTAARNRRGTMITRRHLLAATGSLAAAAAAGPVAAQAPNVMAQGRNGKMQITRSRLAAFPQGAGGLFHRLGPRRSAVSGPDPARAAGGHVTFEPGARTAWHTHPLGQTLIVTSGLGWVQREGGPIEEIRPAMSFGFPPALKHWHGATRDDRADPYRHYGICSTERPSIGWKRSATTNTANEFY